MDEFTKHECIIFLRSLSKAIGISCIIASTNSKITNMIKSVPKKSRPDPSLWCDIWTKLMSADIKAVLKVVKMIKFRTNDEFDDTDDFDYVDVVDYVDDVDMCYLEEFIKHDVDCVETLTNTDSSCINSLLRYMNVDWFTNDMKKDLANIIELIKSQSFTCLQGIPRLALEILLDLIIESRNQDNFDLFGNLISSISKLLLKRKENLSAERGQYLSLDSFSLFPTYSDDEFDEGPASISIDENFYYCGESTSESFNPIKLNRIGNDICKRGSNSSFFIKSHFSKFHENCLVHMSMWHFINFVTFKNVKNTVASLVSKFYDSQYEFVNPRQVSYSSPPQEHMTCLALATASHQDLRGRTDGLTFVKEFAVQSQIIEDLSLFESSIDINLRNLISNNVPSILENYLKSLEIPYFIPQITSAGLCENLTNLVNIGVCKRLAKNEGFDLQFDITGTEEKGFVECKNLKNSVPRGKALEYIYRSLLRKSPLTLMLIREAGQSLRNATIFHDSKGEITFIKESPIIKAQKPESQRNVMRNRSENPVKKPRKAIKTKQKTQEKVIVKVKIFEEMRAKNFNINVYTLCYAEDSDRKSPKSMFFNTLHEVKNPQGSL